MSDLLQRARQREGKHGHKVRGEVGDTKVDAHDTHRATALRNEYLDVLMSCMSPCDACGATPNIPCEHARLWKWAAE
jgi:hypothetical protein